jgi:hypothetical protein
MSSDPLLRLFHTGIIVDSLDEAMSAMGKALRLDWAPPRTSTAPMQCAEGLLDREVRFTYSLQGPHFIELLEQVNPAPYLNLTGGRRVHHLGYYTDDLECASAMLEANGYRRELSGHPSTTTRRHQECGSSWCPMRSPARSATGPPPPPRKPASRSPPLSGDTRTASRAARGRTSRRTSPARRPHRPSRLGVDGATVDPSGDGRPSAAAARRRGTSLYLAGAQSGKRCVRLTSGRAPASTG